MTKFNRLIKVALEDPRLSLARQILGVGAAGFGAGAAARAVSGFANLGREPVDAPFISPGPSALPIAVPGKPGEEEEETPQAAANLKFAQPVATQPAAPSTYDAAASVLAQFLPKDSFSRTARGISGPVLAGAGGLAGGWALTDWVLDGQRKRQLDDELAAAKAEYSQALMGGAKTASTEPTTAELLEQLCDRLEKVANDPPATPAAAPAPAATGLLDMATPAKAWGGYELAAALMAGAGAYGGYKWTKGRSEAELLAKAQRQRARQLWSQNLQPIYMVPASDAA